MPTPIGTLGVVSTLTIAGYVFTDVTSLIRLYGWVNANACTPRKVNTTAGYAPSGVSFRMYAMRASNTGTTGSTVRIGYADNDVGVNAGTATTNPVYNIGTAQANVIGNGTTSGGTFEIDLGSFSVPTTKYPFVESTAGAFGFVIYGVEA